MIGVGKGNIGIKEGINMITLALVTAYTTGLLIGRFLAHRDITRKGWFKYRGKYYGMEQE